VGFQGRNGAQAIETPPQHGAYFNVLCDDTHVASAPLSKLFDPRKTARNWNIDNQPHPEFYWGL